MDRLDRKSIEAIRSWLADRETISSNEHFDLFVYDLNNNFANLDLPDLYLSEYRKDSLKPDLAASPTIQKSDKNLNTLYHIVKWLAEFSRKLRDHRRELETLEQIANGFQKRLAKFHVQEGLDLLSSSLSLDEFVDVKLNQQDHHVEIDVNTWSCQDIICQVLLRVLTYSSISLIVDTSHYAKCLLAAYLVDLMHSSGLPRDQVKLFARDATSTSSSGARHTNTNNTTTDNPSPMNRLSHLSPPATPESFALASDSRQSRTPGPPNTQVVYICLANGPSPREASICILESYLRDLSRHPNAILLVEESIYNLFVEFWRQNYSRLLQENDDLKLLSISVDLNSIDIGVARKTPGCCINMIKFRSLSEMNKLVGSLRKISYVQLWTRDELLARELCLWSSSSSAAAAAINANHDHDSKFSSSLVKRCSEFWLNHLPANVSGRRFGHLLLDHCRDCLRGQQMDEHYSELYHQFEHKIDQLRRQQLVFQRKHSRAKRNQLILGSYLSLITRLKSMKQHGVSLDDSLVRMKRFHQHVTRNQCLRDNDVQTSIELTVRPVGLAILWIRGKNDVVKSKSAVVEFIYKNLLLGNGVLVVLTEPILGLRFPADLLCSRKLPFELIDLSKSQPYDVSLLSSSSPAAPLAQSTPTTSSSPAKASGGRRPMAGGQPKQLHATFAASCLNGNSSWSDSPDSGLANGSGNLLPPIEESPGGRPHRQRRPLRCPNGVYVVHFGRDNNNLAGGQIGANGRLAELTNELVDSLVWCLGCRRRALWLPRGPLVGSARCPSPADEVDDDDDDDDHDNNNDDDDDMKPDEDDEAQLEDEDEMEEPSSD